MIAQIVVSVDVDVVVDGIGNVNERRFLLGCPGGLQADHDAVAVNVHDYDHDYDHAYWIK